MKKIKIHIPGWSILILILIILGVSGFFSWRYLLNINDISPEISKIQDYLLPDSNTQGYNTLNKKGTTE